MLKMRNTRPMQKIGLVMLTATLILVTWISAVTYLNRYNSNPSPIITFAVQNHVAITLILTLVSILYGFTSSIVFYSVIKVKKRESKNILEVVFLFLSADEKEIIKFLITKSGITTQAEISRLPKIGRVKAHRLLQKMQEKRLLEIVPHGKIRSIRLEENIKNLLIEKNG